MCFACYLFPLWKWDYKRGYLSVSGELIAPLTLLSTPVEVRWRCRSSWWRWGNVSGMSFVFRALQLQLFSGEVHVLAPTLRGYRLVSQASPLPYSWACFAFAVVIQHAVPFWGLQLRCLLQCSNTLVGSTSPLLTRWKLWWRARETPELHCYIVVYFKH